MVFRIFRIIEKWQLEEFYLEYIKMLLMEVISIAILYDNSYYIDPSLL